MSFFEKSAFDVTPGTAYEAFWKGNRSPMLPQDYYRQRAAGPANLAGLGEHRYYAPLRQMRQPLQGFGESSPVELVQGLLSQGMNSAVDAMWPALQARMTPMFQPVQIGVYVCAIGAVAAAVFSFLVWNKQSTPSY